MILICSSILFEYFQGMIFSNSSEMNADLEPKLRLSPRLFNQCNIFLDFRYKSIFAFSAECVSWICCNQSHIAAPNLTRSSELLPWLMVPFLWFNCKNSRDAEQIWVPNANFNIRKLNKKNLFISNFRNAMNWSKNRFK